MKLIGTDVDRPVNDAGIAAASLVGGQRIAVFIHRQAVVTLIDRRTSGEKRDRLRRSSVVLKSGRVEQRIGVGEAAAPQPAGRPVVDVVTVVGDIPKAVVRRITGQDGVTQKDRAAVVEDAAAQAAA